MTAPRKERFIEQDGEYLDLLDAEQISLETELTVY